MYDWVTLPYSRNWHDIVNQLYFSVKKKIEKELKHILYAKDMALLQSIRSGLYRLLILLVNLYQK